MFTEDVRKIMNEAQDKITELLNNRYPNLKFLISPNNELCCWVNNLRGEGIELTKPHSLLSLLDDNFFQELNNKIAPAVVMPDKYFVCSECGKVTNMLDLAENVFAGYYCKECAKKPEIEQLITESHKAGFYD